MSNKYDEMMTTMYQIQELQAKLLHMKRFQVRFNDGEEFAHDEGVWCFPTYEWANECYGRSVAEAPVDIDKITLTETQLMDEDEWTLMFPDKRYPAPKVLKEWTRPKVVG